MTPLRVVSPIVLDLILFAPATPSQVPPRSEFPHAADSSQAGGVVLVELVVEDSKSRAITDLKPDDVVIFQDDVRQTVGSLEYRSQYGYYELRYVPSSGRVGAVSIRVLRNGSRLRGPDGPQVKPRWVPPTAAFEVSLQAALDAPEAPTDFEYEVAVLHFEAREDTLHHTFVAEIPLKEVSIEKTGARALAHLSFLVRVRTDTGRTVHEQSLDQPLAFEAPGKMALSVMRFVWSSHVHLRPGRYVVEVAAMDRNTSRRSVRRFPLTVGSWPEGLRMSSLTFLLGRDGLMRGEKADDNPFHFEEAALVPMLRPMVAGSEAQLSLFAVVYTDRTSGEPISATIELHRDGQLRAQTALPLPAADPGGQIRYLGGLRVRSLQPGSYDLKVVVQQGTARVEEKATLTVTPPLHVN